MTMPTKGNEFFSMEGGKKVDAHLHEPMLDNPEAQDNDAHDMLKRLIAKGYPQEMIDRVAKGFAEEQLERKPDNKMNRGGVPGLLHRAKTMAKGGSAPTKAEYAPWDINQGAHWRIKNPPMAHIPHNGGMIKSSIPGRTDKIPLSLKAGSYVVPADSLSALGQGNSVSGGQIFSKMLGMGPYGSSTTGKVSSSRGSHPKLNLGSLRTGKAEGGEVEGEQRVPIIAAGNEFIIPPEVVTEIGHGDIDKGHRVLDALVLKIRKEHIATLRSLKPPKGS